MTISSRLRVILAQINLDQAQRGLPGISLRHVACESGISLSVLTALQTGRSQRIDYRTLDRLLAFLNHYQPTRLDDVLMWDPS